MDFSSCIQTTLDGSVLLDIEVQPASTRIGITGFNEWRSKLTVCVTAEAQYGKANEALKHVLSKVLGIDKSSVNIVSGTISRNKKIRIDNLDLNNIKQKITMALGDLT